jgi:hypothetical protein
MKKVGKRRLRKFGKELCLCKFVPVSLCMVGARSIRIAVWAIKTIDYRDLHIYNFDPVVVCSYGLCHDTIDLYHQSVCLAYGIA